jgi:hypothetical protein
MERKADVAIIGAVIEETLLEALKDLAGQVEGGKPPLLGFETV